MMLELGFKVGDITTSSKNEKGVEVKKLKFTGIKNAKISVVDEALKQPATPIDLAEFQMKKWKIFVLEEVEWLEYLDSHSQHDSVASIQKIATSSAIEATHTAWHE